MKKIVPLGLALGLLLVQGCQTAMQPDQWAARHQYKNSEIIRIEIGRNNFPLIPGRVDSTDVKIFFDTGNFFGYEISPDLARGLQLSQSGNERREYDSSGTYRSSRKGYMVDSFEAFQNVSKGIEFFESADNDFQASVGIWDLLGRRFTLDMKNRLLGISGQPFAAGRPSIEEFPLVWNDRRNGMIVIDGTVNGIETLIQIDTGKSRTTIDESLVSLAGLKENNTIFQKGYKVDRITLGKNNYSIECAKAADFSGISEGYPKPILVGIGVDILERIILTVDYIQGKVFIERSDP